MTWSYWIFCTVISAFAGYVTTVVVMGMFQYSFVFKLLIPAVILAVFIVGIPLHSIPIVKDEKKVNESYVLDIPYEKGNYVKVSNGENTRYINFIKNGEDETLEIRKGCKIKYKIGKKNKISYKRKVKRNIFGTIYYSEISNVVITKEK